MLEWNSILEDLKKTTAGEVTYKDDLLAKFVGAVIHTKADTSSDRQIALAFTKNQRIRFLGTTTVIKALILNIMISIKTTKNSLR